MKIIAEFSIIPIGVGLSLSKYIAACERILMDKKLKFQLHAEGTNVEGELSEVLETLQICIDTVHKLGAPRIITNIKISSRVDKPENMQDKVKSVEKQI